MIKDAIFNLRYIPIGIIYIYRKTISPFLKPSCRFYPSCSVYACQAFEKYGILKGACLTAVRLLKCNPFNPGGYNPLR